MERPLPIEGRDFEYVETDDAEVRNRSVNPVVEILEGLYMGALVQYGKIEFLIEETPPRLAFDYIILDGGGVYSREGLSQDSDFKNLLGDIILSTIANYEKNLNENRNNDPQITD